ncbi:MAG TPA: HlyD family efflux transporter periplasmic adaptor subunit [Terriglobia bacterium]
MAKTQSRSWRRWIIILVVVVAAAALIGYQVWQKRKSALPAGIVSGNGRLEAKLVDVAAKESLRVKEILVDEGAIVTPGQVVVQMDTMTLAAELAEAKQKVAAAQEQIAAANAAIVKRNSEIELAKLELARTEKLLKDRAASQEQFDIRQTAVQTNMAGLAQDEAQLQTAKQQVEVALANAAVIQTRIDDATLKSPVRGRVLYRLAEVGEVLGPGGKALTLVNLEDVYMEIFLPSEEAARARIGSEARITLDAAPGLAAPGYVSFVSPEAQFTPKQVETPSERSKLMFRVKIQVPEEVVASYIEYVKTGVRGVGYVKLDQYALWPARLQNLFTSPQEPGPVIPAKQRLKEVPYAQP